MSCLKGLSFFYLYCITTEELTNHQDYLKRRVCYLVYDIWENIHKANIYQVANELLYYNRYTLNYFK